MKNDDDGRLVARWWGKKLLEKAFADSVSGIYTDQKWIDMVPSFINLSRIHIIKNPGCDFAPWNYAERTVSKINNQFYAISRNDGIVRAALTFVHYSAYNYKKLVSENIIESKYKMSDYPEMTSLLDEYRIALESNNTLEKLKIKSMIDDLVEKARNQKL